VTFKDDGKKVILKGHTIIIGGGKMGQNLMKNIPNSVLIESGPVKVYWLTRQFGEDRIIHGDGADVKLLIKAGIKRARAVIVTISQDNVNYKIATAMAPFGVHKALVRVDDEAFFKTYRDMRMEPFKITPAMSAKIIERILRPEAIHIHEFILPAKCNAVGLKVEALDLPNEIKLISVLRGEHLEVPEPNLVLQEGDVLTVMASEEDVLALRGVLGARLDLNPLQRIYVPYKGKTTVKQALREAFILAKYANAEVTLIYDKNNKVHKRASGQLEQMFKIQDVKMGLKGLKDLDGKGLKTYLKKVEDSFDEALGREIIHYDFVLMDPVVSSAVETFLGATKMKRAMKGIVYPVIIAGNMNPYKSLLMLIDSSEHSDLQVSMTIDLAILFGSRVHMLIHQDDDEDPEHIDRLVKYVTRAGRLYGLQVTNQYIEGNPSLEFIEKVKSDEFDLVVVNWRCRTIKRGIVRRIVEYGPRSVLIIP